MLKSFIQSKANMTVLMRSALHGYNIPSADVDDVVFETLMRADTWWTPDKGTSFATAVLKQVLPSVCADFHRRNHERYNNVPLEDECLVDDDPARVEHFKRLLEKVMDDIFGQENPVHRSILINVLINEVSYDELITEHSNPRMVVSRFREYLWETYGEEMYW